MVHMLTTPQLSWFNVERGWKRGIIEETQHGVVFPRALPNLLMAFHKELWILEIDKWKVKQKQTIGINLQFQGIAHHFQNLQCQSFIQLKEFFYTVFKQISILYKNKISDRYNMFLLELMSCKCRNTPSGLPAVQDLYCKWTTCIRNSKLPLLYYYL